MIEFIYCTRDSVQLCYDSYSYTKQVEKTNRIRWECMQWKTAAAKKRLADTISLLCDDLHVTVPHNHMADVAAVNAEKVKAAMHERVHDT